jgi:hypothetical protein
MAIRVLKSQSHNAVNVRRIRDRIIPTGSTDGYAIIADSGTPTGLSWAAFAGSNYYVDSLDFDTDTGTLTLGRSGLVDLTKDLDGRYLLSASALVSPLTTKGDIWVYGPANTRLPVGTDSYALVADSTTATGLNWAANTEANYYTTAATMGTDGILTGTVGGGGSNWVSTAFNVITDEQVAFGQSTSGLITGSANFIYDGTDLTLSSATTLKPALILNNTTDDAYGPSIELYNNRATEADDDAAGYIKFFAADSGDAKTEVARITGYIDDVTAGEEEGSLAFSVAEYDGTLTEAMRIVGQGTNTLTYVGIGTTTPNEQLEISSDDPRIRLNDTDGQYAIIDGGAGNIDFKADVGAAGAGSKFGWFVDGEGSASMTYDSTGLGIGTTAPNYNLHINGGAGNAVIQLTNTDTGVTTGDGCLISLGGDESFNFTQREDNHMVFATNNTDRLYISGNGNVGVGTITPTMPFTVVGSQMGIERYHGTDTYAPAVIMRKAAGTEASPSIVADGELLGQIRFQGWTDTWRDGANINAEVDGTPGSGADLPAALTFLTTPDGTGEVVERMRIDSAGNVGIGTDTPARTLDVAGTVGVDDYIYHNSDSDTYMLYGTNTWRLVVGDETALYALADGAALIGINTTSPQTYSDALTVKGPSTNSNPFGIINSDATVKGGMRTDKSDNYVSFHTVSESDLRFYYNNTESNAMIIKGSGATAGNVGIGTTAPAEKLNVRASTLVGSATQTGSGLDDMTSQGTFVGLNTDLDYRVKIDATGTPDTFTWSDDDGSTWEATGVSITASAQALNNGVTVTFGATTGHTLNDYWDFSTTTNNPLLLEDESGNDLFFVGNDGNVGIGEDETTDPDAKLHIRGDAAHLRISSKDYHLISMGPRGDTGANLDKAGLNMMATDGSSKVWLDTAGDSYLNGGNVGIGTAVPSYPLHVAAAGTGLAALFTNTSSNGTVLQLTTTGDSKELYLQTDHIYSNGTLYFGNNSYATNFRGSSYHFDTGDINADGTLGITGLITASGGLTLPATSDNFTMGGHAVNDIVVAADTPTADDTHLVTAGYLNTVSGAIVAGEAPATTPGGGDTQIQFNNGGAFGGTAGFTTTDDGSDVTLSNATTLKPILALTNTTDDAYGPSIELYNNRATEADDDAAGYLKFFAADSGDAKTEVARITGYIDDVTAGEEEGSLAFSVAEYDGTLTEAMRIVGQGTNGLTQVGIGTATPSYTLDVYKADADGNPTVNLGDGDKYLRMYIDDEAYVQSDDSIYVWTRGSGKYAMLRSEHADVQVRANTFMELKSGDATTMYLSAGNKVGIGGTTAPLGELHIVSGTSKAVGDATNPAIQFGSNDGSYRGGMWTTTEGMYLQNKNGDHGIIMYHRDAEVARFMSGSLHLAEEAAATGDVAGYGQFWVKSDAPNKPYFTDDAGTDFDLTAGETNVFTGTVPDTFIPMASGGADILRGFLPAYVDVTTDNNVFLGTIPASLDSAADQNTSFGHLALENLTTGDANTAVGMNAGNDLTQGYYNTLIGYAAGAWKTTEIKNTCIGYAAGPNAGGGDNVAVGTYAAYSHTGNYCVIIGADAAYNTTGVDSSVIIGRQAWGTGVGTGDDNVVIGSLAGQDLTSAAQTILIGSNAGSNLTTGTYNTVMGYDALKASVGGTYNVALGWMAMRYHSQAASGYNVALGSKAMYNIDTGINNVVLGDSAMYGKQGTTNSDNVVIGPSALYYASGAINNVAVGSHALNATTTGDNNTAIGLYAGINNTTGDGNVFIGSSAGPSSTNTDDDKLYIHNANGTPLIAGDFSAGTVTIDGTLSATAKSFNIPHPLYKDKRLVHGSLEGPEHGIYIRGTIEAIEGCLIELPEYWSAMCEDYTVQLTPHGPYTVFIKEKQKDRVMVDSSSKDYKFDYYIVGARTDVTLEVVQDG